MVHLVDTTRLYGHILQTWPGDPPVMDLSNLVTASSFGVLDPVKKEKNPVKRLSGATKQHFVSEVDPGEGLRGLQPPSEQRHFFRYFYDSYKWVIPENIHTQPLLV